MFFLEKILPTLPLILLITIGLIKPQWVLWSKYKSRLLVTILYGLPLVAFSFLLHYETIQENINIADKQTIQPIKKVTTKNTAYKSGPLNQNQSFNAYCQYEEKFWSLIDNAKLELGRAPNETLSKGNVLKLQRPVTFILPTQFPQYKKQIQKQNINLSSYEELDEGENVEIKKRVWVHGENLYYQVHVIDRHVWGYIAADDIMSWYNTKPRIHKHFYRKEAWLKPRFEEIKSDMERKFNTPFNTIVHEANQKQWPYKCLSQNKINKK